MVSRGSQPRGIDFDRICNDSEDGNAFSAFLEVSFEKIRVNWICSYNCDGGKFLHEALEVALGPTHEGEAGF